MHRNRPRFAALLLPVLLASPHLHGDESAFPVTGGVGFNWLAPQTARCARLTEQDVKQFKACTFHESGAFGLPLAYHACPMIRGGEVLVFRSMTECTEALETMQANAP
jgi:hypothetical protein